MVDLSINNETSTGHTDLKSEMTIPYTIDNDCLRFITSTMFVRQDARVVTKTRNSPEYSNGTVLLKSRTEHTLLSVRLYNYV